MAKRKRRYYDSYNCVKSFQWKAQQTFGAVSGYDLGEAVVNMRDKALNKKRRSRVGHVERRNGLD